MLGGVGKAGEKMKAAQGDKKMPRGVQASGRRRCGLEQGDEWDLLEEAAGGDAPSRHREMAEGQPDRESEKA